MQILTVLSGAGALLVAGVFAAFTWLVLPAFARTGPGAAAPVMQAVNVVAVRAPLMTALFGTGACCLALAVLALVSGRPGPAAGCAVYLVGCLGVTVAGNVPLNDALARGRVTDFARWAAAWGRWNTVRLLACLATAAVLWGTSPDR
ncbi:anthrone oxygenase family protein [Kineococcus aurantiacus]|uniref:Putative membrane protein n=1 Tax=Kineococcus aurantiacus TaxID=37633 RepID=A0A7Y9DNI8_9ACTN|nr:putative membrane protein [Kineococcus aurantiacus]